MRSLLIFLIFLIFSNCDANHIQITRTFENFNATNLSPFTKIGNRHYWIENDIRLNWFEAANFCRTKGAHLVSFEDKEQTDALFAYLEKQIVINDYWIGAYDLAKQGDFHWIDSGLPLSYTRWRGMEPNNHKGNEHCVEILYRESHYSMNDVICEKRARFVCKVPSVKIVKFKIW